jgi:hypothetical protein
MNIPYQPVFFILGSVRSGTTLLRDILKHHPNLQCPEETHIFRWAEPFNSTDYNHVNLHAETLKLHRKMDDFDETDFSNILSQSTDRKHFLNNYFDSYKKTHNLNDCRIFDKTPQNVYGLPLIKAYYPEAKIVHIIRNPLNVVASLKKGNELTPQNLIGAINFWKEAVLIINTLKPILSDNLYELKYEDLTVQPEQEIYQLLDFLGEEKIDMSDALEVINPAKDSYLDIIDENEVALVNQELSEWMRIYGY